MSRSNTRGMRVLEKVAFAAGLAALVFSCGFAAAKLEFFPHDQLARVGRVARAVYRDWRPSELANRRIAHDRSGVTSAGAATAAAGGDDLARLMTIYEPTGGRAVLVDAVGRELHAWQTTFSEVWGSKAPHIDRQAADERIHWRGGHVFPNGDFIFTFEGGNFPYGGGLVRLDQHSRVQWRLARNTHHDFSVLDDGRIVVPSQEFRWTRVTACGRWLQPPYYDDQVLVVSAAGEVEETISVLEAVCGSEFRSLLLERGTAAVHGKITSEDPLHLNDAEVITAELAPRFPMAEAGDILVSLRNVNALAIIDRETRKVRWQLVGPFVRQHDPDLLPNGNIMVFDNRGGAPDRGGSRVIELNPVTQAVVWKFEGTAEAPLDSSRVGNQALLPNGNLLIAESRGGRALEVTRTAEPRVVWEYVSLRERDDEGGGRPNAVMHVDGVDRRALRFLDRLEVAG